jgi:PadR family transcriptional regulator PadR
VRKGRALKDLTKIEEILLVTIWHLKENAYGVKIRQHVSSVIGRDLTYGHLYSALNQLAAKEYVEKSEGKPTIHRLGRPRVYYSITPEGLEAMRAAASVNEKIWSGISKVALERGKTP